MSIIPIETLEEGDPVLEEIEEQETLASLERAFSAYPVMIEEEGEGE